MADISSAEDVDIENMKVIDLRKKLKDLGLPATGNKPELVERLQEALISGVGGDQSELETSLLLGTESVPPSHTSAENSKLFDEALLFSSPEKENVTGVVAQSQNTTFGSASKPLKKRLIVEATEALKKPMKKIVLKRDNIIIPKAAQETTPVVTVKSMEKISVIKNDVPKLNAAATDDKDDSGNAANPSEGGVKKLSDDERIKLRAKRFNITAPDNTTKVGKGTVSSNKNSLSKIFKSSTTEAPPSLDVLRKRAERFGVNVSTTMKKLEEKEKLLKRKSKFGAITSVGVVSTDEQDKKKKRAERFGQ